MHHKIFLLSLLTHTIIFTKNQVSSDSEFNFISNCCSDDLDDFIPHCELRCVCTKDKESCGIFTERVPNNDYFLTTPESLSSSFKNLTLTESSVKFLPSELGKNLYNLEIYSTQKCAFKIITKRNFQNLRRLKHLSLINGELTDICSDTFDDLVSLEYLDLQINEIKFIHPKLFQNIKNVEKILLNSNSIEMLHPTTFQGLFNLIELDLSHNNLIYIEGELFSDNSKIDSLYLNGNDLKVIELTAFSSIDSLIDFSMSDGPCTEDFVPEYDDDLLAMDVLKDYVNRHCNKYIQNFKEINERMMTLNKWFRSNYVIEKCGKSSAEYFDVHLNGSRKEFCGSLMIIMMILSGIVMNICRWMNE